MKRVFGKMFVLGAALVTFPAMSAVLVSSNATGASLSLSAASVVKATATIDPVTGSTMTVPFDNTASVGASNQNWLITNGALVDTYSKLNVGAATSEASGSTSGLATATGTTTITNAGTTLQTGLVGIPVIALGIGADAITSTSTVSQGSDGLLHATGSSVITGLSLTGGLLGALSLDLSTLVTATPNTRVLSLPGLSLTFNEQLLSGDGSNSLSLQTNAIHLSLSDYLFNGSVLNGDVVLGQSQAQISAVPEVGTWAMMIFGFGAIGYAMRRNRKTGLHASGTSHLG
jgi:hypothetical protein